MFTSATQWLLKNCHGYSCISYVPSIAEMEVSVSGCLERVLVAIKSSSYSKKSLYIPKSTLASFQTGDLTSGYSKPYCAHVSYLKSTDKTPVEHLLYSCVQIMERSLSRIPEQYLANMTKVPCLKAQFGPVCTYYIIVFSLRHWLLRVLGFTIFCVYTCVS